MAGIGCKRAAHRTRAPVRPITVGPRFANGGLYATHSSLPRSAAIGALLALLNVQATTGTGKSRGTAALGTYVGILYTRLGPMAGARRQARSETP